MAGSRDWFEYQADNNTIYAVQVDVSNSDALTNPGAQPLMLGRVTAAAGLLPKGFRMRYALAYNQAKPEQRRRFWIGNPAAVANVLTPGQTIVTEDYPGPADTNGVDQTWVITAFRGERSRLVPATTAPDTGLTDS